MARLAASQSKVCNAQFFLDSGIKQRSNSQIGHLQYRPNEGLPMRHPLAAPTSSLPSLMMPCPVCAGRMAYHGHRPVSADVEDTVYACRRCGAELIRTSVRRTPAQKPAAA
ncbi:MAG TPA: hypothetical protein VMA30_22940 [Xanthobacteraceae bacterium]|nr:hypothetical protein [Xanthobacteraceae bacterium]